MPIGFYYNFSLIGSVGVLFFDLTPILNGLPQQIEFKHILCIVGLYCVVRLGAHVSMV